MTGWRYSDREWFRNDRLNLRTEAIRRLVIGELTGQNVLFGSHRWFAGGAAEDDVAITSVEEWDAELARGRPGDNVILLSLRQVTQLALVHAGSLDDPGPLALSAAEIAAVEARSHGNGLGELLCVRRSSRGASVLAASCRHIDLRDGEWPWRDQLQEAGGGEMWLFEGDLDWRDHERRQFGTEPPEAWTAHHGIVLVDGVVPDAEGRVVCGGPY